MCSLILSRYIYVQEILQHVVLIVYNEGHAYKYNSLFHHYLAVFNCSEYSWLLHLMGLRLVLSNYTFSSEQLHVIQ